MTKALYGRLFSWIVNKINQQLAPEETIAASEATEIGKLLKETITKLLKETITNLLNLLHIDDH